MSIPVLDEEMFAKEVASRLNTFLHTYPEEAQRIFQVYLNYEHELKEIHNEIIDAYPDFVATPGCNIAMLFCALLQTPHGQGWFVKANYRPDPKNKIGSRVVSEFVVERQTP